MMTVHMPAALGRPVSRACMLAALGLLGLGGAQAQIKPMARNGDAMAHRVVAGDTLEQLAARYLGDARQWTDLQQHNGVANPYRLRPGSVLEIPVRLLRAAVASVEFVQGDARSTRPLDHLADTQGVAGDDAGQPLRKGQTLQEGERLQLAPDAFVAVRLADGSLVRVQSQSDVVLRQMRRKGRAGSLQSVLDLREGGVEASVPPEPGNAQRRFEIRTPAASTSVRGTRFLVQADAAGSTAAAVDEGTVAVGSDASSANTGDALLRPGQGVAVAANGRVGEPRPMLGAPDITAWPALAEDANWISLPLPGLPGAVRYQLQLSRDADMTQVLRSASFQATASPLRLAGVEDGDYVLSLRGIDAQGIPGAASRRALRVKAHPVPPLYESPQADATVGLGRASLQCTQVVGAARYRIQVVSADAQAGFAEPAIDARDLKDCTLPATTLARLPAGRYLWRAASIRTLADGQPDQGPFAAAQAMQLAAVPPQPSASALQMGDGPAEGSRQIRWSGEPGQRYHVMVARDQEFTAPLVDLWTDQPQWSTEELPAGSYYLRLQIEDANGLRSDFSAARQFRTGSWIVDASGEMMHSGNGERLQRQ
nr:FecR domain-containing protein [Delftia acidovorans]